MIHNLTAAASGGTLNAAAGDTLTLSLAETPTTGHRWTVDGQGGLALVLDGYKTGGDAPGAAGLHIFTWTAVAGSHDLRLSLRRQWEAPDLAIGRFAMTIKVV